MSAINVELDTSHGRGMLLLRISGVEAITPLVLIEVADLCQERYKACDDRNKITWHMLSRNAKDIVNHDACPEEGVSILGHFMLADMRIPEAGDEVIVRKGAYLRSYHPSFNMKGKITARKQRVTVDHVIGGYIDFHHGIVIKNPEVRWAGSGGYWKWVSPADMDVVEQQEVAA